MKVNTYIGFWTLNVKCTQYGICGKVAVNNARAMVFSKLAEAATSFQSGPQNPDFFSGAAAPKRIHLPGKALRGEEQ